MSDVNQAFETAVKHHQGGNLREAERIYRQILQADPRHVGALHLFGLIANQVGNNEIAIRFISEAIRLKPDFADAHSNLGNALQDQGQLEEAVASYRQALRLKPNFAAALNNLGNVLEKQGKLDEAVASYGQALRLQPNYAEGLNNRANALRQQGKLDEAVADWREAIRLKPDYAKAYSNLGIALQDRGNLAEGIACIQQALRLNPDSAEMHNNLGAAVHKQGKLEEAVASYAQALRLKPDYAKAHSNRGDALMEQGKLDEAVADWREAIRLKPDYAEAHNNLGAALQEQGKLPEAVVSFQEALRLKSDYAEAHKNLALTMLLMGNLEQGWKEFEWRWRCKELPPPNFPQPRWDGSPLGGRTILLFAEQGLGDTLQFIRYAPLLRERGGRVLAACPSSLLRLLASCPGIDQSTSASGPLPPFDVHAPIMSLPGIFGTTLATVPAQAPYLFADAALIDTWRQRMRQSAAFKIGIAWQGNPSYRGDRYRSIPLVHFEPLARLPGVELVSLQRRPGAEQRQGLAGRFAVTDLGNIDEASGAFMDTAAIMKNLDLFVTSDSAVAHLAGALGVPVWVALPTVPDWRWLLARADSPWYPTMRLFRQTEQGNWPEVFARIAGEVKKLLGAPRDRAIQVEISPGGTGGTR